MAFLRQLQPNSLSHERIVSGESQGCRIYFGFLSFLVVWKWLVSIIYNTVYRGWMVLKKCPEFRCVLLAIRTDVSVCDIKIKKC